MTVKEIPRAASIHHALEAGKVLMIYGARQVGKTTLVNRFLSETPLRWKAFNGDRMDFAQDFSKCSLPLMKQIAGNAHLLFIDEAQQIPNVGRALKLLVDSKPSLYIIVTGSSSFDLANAASEALTGRKNLLLLYPIAMQELLLLHSTYELHNNLADYLIYGAYPEVITYPTHDEKKQRIVEITNSYLIKDILTFNKVKHAQPVISLLRLLAFQIGGLVSTTELGKKLGIDNKTVERYLDLLQKSFVLFRLSPFSRNLRNEINKMSKYYFYDLGIRNALIANFNPLAMRNDVGQLWENFLMVERRKHNAYNKQLVNHYFWRTHSKKEIDLIEERGGRLYGYEFKWSRAKNKPPQEWLTAYTNEQARCEIVTAESTEEYLPFICQL